MSGRPVPDELSLDRFPAFFHAVYGCDPFPWQERLVRQVLEAGDWPRVVSLPTAAGKTAVIDIAVFALAVQASLQTRRRTAPRRIFFVIDRRVVVDQTRERAERLATALHESCDPVVQAVARALRSLAGSDTPLAVTALRGGIEQDRTWMRSPTQPLVCISTVDQVGSRLLFRAYGSGRSPWNALAVQAGLLGNDSLLVLDETHLSVPFEETLGWLERYRAWAECPIPGPWAVVRMSATPRGPTADTVFTEDQADYEHHVLGRRLRACKLASLKKVVTARLTSTEAEAQDRSALVAEASRCAREFAEPGAIVGIVLNRVRAARETFEALDDIEGCDALLLTGRVRPYERDRLLERFLPRIRTNRERDVSQRPLFVVATQCIEVGADLDFDALVTECAPLSALRQRLGRLDRSGEREKSRVVILARSDQIRKQDQDPIYGAALAATWRWLEAQLPRGRGISREIDLGPIALAKRTSEAAVSTLEAPARHAPVVFPSYMDLWSQTSPIPHPDPDPAIFLHGPESQPPNVDIVWRGDLDPAHPAEWGDTVALAPPSPGEAMSLPFIAVRRWLTGLRHLSDTSDVEGADLAEAIPDDALGRSSAPALRWAGANDPDTREVRASEIRPGDTLIVPSRYGGTDEYGWLPSAMESSHLPASPDSDPECVRDIAEEVAMATRGALALRIHPDLASKWMIAGGRELATDAVQALLSDDPVGPELERELLNALATDAEFDWLRDLAASLVSNRRRRIPYPDGRGVLLLAQGTRGIDDSTLDSGNSPSSVGRAVELPEHHEGVVAWVRHFSRLCGLPIDLQEALALAAAVHDLGKVDPRFQVMLHGGDEVSASAAHVPLAKSGMDPRNRAARNVARQRSGYPTGYPHESASVALLLSDPTLLDQAPDRELVLHLVASHHGLARPLFPAIVDSAPVDLWTSIDGASLSITSAHALDAVGSGIAERYWLLNGRYGWYGLAYLESILRQADWARSAEEATRGGE